jgi:outer membrane immunogenic protein
MKEVAPAPSACPNWGGFYFGGFGGYKFGATDIDLNLTGDWNTIPDLRDRLEAAASQDLDMDGGELGGLIGVNFQSGNWVFGAEAEGGYLWLRDSHQTIVAIINDSGTVYNIETSLKTHYLFTFGPRIGYALCRWLPYVTGGLAIGDIDFDQSLLHSGLGDIGERGSTSDAQVGWMVGGGLEYALSDHWRIRGQYQFVDLGCADFHSEFNTDPTFTGRHEACLREHNASFAIIYKF